jgi:hypothetical protein
MFGQAGTQVPNTSSQIRPVRVTNYARAIGRPAVGQFVSGREHGDLWRRTGMDMVDTGCCDTQEAVGPDKLSAAQYLIPCTEILTGESYVVASRCGLFDNDPARRPLITRLFFNAFNRYDGIGTDRNGCARHDFNGRPGSEFFSRSVARGHHAFNRKTNGMAIGGNPGVGRPHSKTVHCRVGKSGHINRADYVTDSGPIAELVQGTVRCGQRFD